MAEFDVRFGSGIPEDSVSAPPGSIWIQNSTSPPRSTLWRKLTGTGSTGWIRSELNVFNIRDFGAKCDHTDDTDAWRDAIAEAHRVSGVVFHPGATNDPSDPSESTSGVSWIIDELIVPLNSSIQFIGGPSAIIQAIDPFPEPDPEADPPFFPAMLKIQSTIGTAGSRYGAVRDLRFDGGGRAAIGLQVNAVQREFQNLVIENCLKCGLYLDGAQNCTFESVNAEKNGTNDTTLFPDCNVCLDLGARNNAFFRCQMSAFRTTTPPTPPPDQGVYNLVICQTATSEIADGEPPSFNSFFGCQIERTSEAASNLGAVLQSAGRYNSFHASLIQTRGERRVITINDANNYVSGAMRLTDCTLSGEAGQSIALRAESVRELEEESSLVIKPTVIFSGGTLAEGFEPLLQVDDFSDVEISGPIYHGSSTFVDPLGTNTLPALAVQRSLRLDGVPSNSTGIPPTYFDTTPWFYDAANHVLWFYVGSWRSVDAFQQDLAGQNVSGGALVTINPLAARYFRLTVIDGTAFSINIPYGSRVGRLVTIDIYNNSGGTMGDITWLGGSGRVSVAGSNVWGTGAKPTNGKHRLITFAYSDPYWREISRTDEQSNSP
jgi:hypothetical protein